MHLSRMLYQVLFVLSLTTITISGCAPQPSIEAINNHLITLADVGEFSGVVLVSSAGEVLLEEAYGLFDREQDVPMTIETRFPLHYVTMQFTAAAVMKLQELGALDVQDHICQFLDECPVAWQPITIHHLLNQTAGVSDYVQPWGLEVGQPSTTSELIHHITTEDTDFHPGDGFRYSHNGYIILGYIIEVASGQTYEDFLRDQFFGPLQMNNTGMSTERVPPGFNEGLPPVTHLDPVYRYSSSGIISTTADLVIWTQALMHGEVLSEDSLEAMFTGYATTPSMDFPGSRYGYGWFVGEVHGRRAYFHGGMDPGYTAFLIHFPDEDLTIIVLRNYGLDIYDRLEINLAEMILQ